MSAKVIKQNETIDIRERYDLKELILYSDGYVSIEGCITTEELLELAQQIYDLVKGRSLVE